MSFNDLTNQELAIMAIYISAVSAIVTAIAAVATSVAAYYTRSAVYEARNARLSGLKGILSVTSSAWSLSSVLRARSITTERINYEFSNFDNSKPNRFDGDKTKRCEITLRNVSTQPILNIRGYFELLDYLDPRKLSSLPIAKSIGTNKHEKVWLENSKLNIGSDTEYSEIYLNHKIPFFRIPHIESHSETSIFLDWHILHNIVLYVYSLMAVNTKPMSSYVLPTPRLKLRIAYDTPAAEVVVVSYNIVLADLNAEFLLPDGRTIMPGFEHKQMWDEFRVYSRIHIVPENVGLPLALRDKEIDKFIDNTPNAFRGLYGYTGTES